MAILHFQFILKIRTIENHLKEDQETIILADQLGFNEAFIGEHVTDEYERITSSSLFISTLIHQTKK